jgi:hypothetical protein
MSDEQLALIELNVNMTKQFNELNKRIKQLEKTLIADVVEAEYREVLNNIFSQLKAIFRKSLQN